MKQLLIRARAMVLLPAILAHESLHAAAALPWARRVQIEIVPAEALAVHRVEWSEDVGRIVRTIAALAPLLAGLVAAVAAAWLGLLGVPRSSSQMALLAIAAVYWMAVCVSPADLIRVWRGGDG